MPEKRLDMTAIVALLVIAVVGLGTLSLLAAVGVLDSNDAADWVTAVGTICLVIVASVALWPTARQVKQAARASAESHRPYVSMGTRVSVKGSSVPGLDKPRQPGGAGSRSAPFCGPSP